MGEICYRLITLYLSMHEVDTASWDAWIRVIVLEIARWLVLFVSYTMHEAKHDILLRVLLVTLGILDITSVCCVCIHG